MSGSSSKRTGKKTAHKQAKVIKNLNYGVSEIQVHLIDRKIDESTRLISAYLIDSNTGKRLQEAAVHTHRYDTRVSHPAIERQAFRKQARY